VSDDKKDDGNWASPAELAEAMKSGEIDPSIFLPAGANRKERRAFAKKHDVPTPVPQTITTSHIMSDAWDQLAKEVMPLSATPEQHKWAKRLFMAGGFTVFNILMNHTHRDTLDESDPNALARADLERLDAIYHELNAFFSAIASLN
jgi:hypothetical protein